RRRACPATGRGRSPCTPADRPAAESCHAARVRPQGPVRPVRPATAAGRRRGPEGDRVRAGHAQGGRSRHPLLLRSPASGGQAFGPVFDELNRRKAVVHVHPYDPPGVLELLAGTRPHLIEWPTDTSRAIWSVIDDSDPKGQRESLATRCPDITFIWAHSGGTLVALAWRFLFPHPPAAPAGNAPPQHLPLSHL